MYFSFINIRYLPLKFEKSNLPEVYLTISSNDYDDMVEAVMEENKRLERDAKLIYNGQNYDINLEIKSGTPHWESTQKSWVVKSVDQLIEGQSRINFIIARDKEFILEGYGYFVAEKLGLKVPEHRFVDLFINGKKQGVYFEVEQWSKEMLEKKELTGDTNFYGDIALSHEYNYVDPQNYTNNPNRIILDTSDVYMLEYVMNHPSDKFFWDNIFSIIDKENFYKWQVHSVLMDSAHQHSGHNNHKLYFDPTKGKFVAFPWDVFVNSSVYPRYTFIDKEMTYNSLVTRILKNKRYMQERNELLYEVLNQEELWSSGKIYFNKLMNRASPSLAKDHLKLVSTKEAIDGVRLQYDSLTQRRKILLEYLDGGNIVVESHIYNNKYNLKVVNKHISGVNIVGVKFRYPNLQAISKILSSLPIKTDQYDIDCNTEELTCYVKVIDQTIISNREIRKNNISDIDYFFVTEGSINLNLPSFMVNFDEIKITAINTVTNNNIRQKDIKGVIIDHRIFDEFEKINLSKSEFLSENKGFIGNESGISIGPGSFYFNKNVVIPKDINLTIQKGTVLVFETDKSLLSYSSVTANGTLYEPIKVILDNGVFIVVDTVVQNSFSYCNFSGGGKQTLNGVFVSGMFSVYHGDTEIDSCKFINANGDAAVNLKYGTVLVKNSIFSSNSFDALDLDFVNSGSLITKNTFINNGDDSIDISGSKLEVADNIINNSKDNCLSIGENTNVLIKGNRLDNCFIGLAIKDHSHADIEENIITNMGTGVSIYKKKEIFGGGAVNLVENIFKGNDEDLVVDKYSQILSCKGNEISNDQCIK